MSWKKINGKEYLFIEIPEDANYVCKSGNKLYFKRKLSRLIIEHDYLVDVNYRVVGRALYLTETKLWKLASTTAISLCDANNIDINKAFIVEKL